MSVYVIPRGGDGSVVVRLVGLEPYEIREAAFRVHIEKRIEQLLDVIGGTEFYCTDQSGYVFSAFQDSGKIIIRVGFRTTMISVSEYKSLIQCMCELAWRGSTTMQPSSRKI